MMPAWLKGVLGEKFFEQCGIHLNCRKNEKNIFCLNCCLSFCPHCLPSHSTTSHPLLQVRRYVYQNVIRLDDLEKLVDCCYIQPYTINSAKVIFLNQRAQSRSCKGSGNTCFTCDRILQEPFNFCSLSCKVDHMTCQGEDLSSILYRFDESDFTISRFEGLSMDASDDAQMTPINPFDPILEEYRGASHSSYGIGNAAIFEEEEATKRKGKGGFLPGIMLSLSSRRKGAPHRSPLS